MVELRVTIIVVMLMALIFGAIDGKRQQSNGDHGGHGGSGHGGGGGGGGGGSSNDCTNNPEEDPFKPPCSTTSELSSSTEQPTTPDSTYIITSTVGLTSSDGSLNVTDGTSTSTTSQPTSLERAHWCRFSNGTYLSLGYTYIDANCGLCQCTTSRLISREPLKCMPTYCVNDSMIVRKSGQCCTQCDYELVRNSCEYGGVLFPHGVILKSVENKMQCWCQLGNIECRTPIGSLFQGMNFWADPTAIYVIVVVLCIVLIFGVLLCCGCTLFTYYYYQRNQHTFQQAYDQYVNSAGWQPMGEDEQQVVDGSAEEKHIEAEQNQFNNPIHDNIPPPYVVYNNSYVSEAVQK